MNHLRSLHSSRGWLLSVAASFILAVVTAHVTAQPACSEEREIYGVNFSVDRIQQLDATTVKVVAGNGSIVTRAGEVNQFIVTHWASDPTFVRSLTPAAVQRFLEAANKAKDNGAAQALLKGVLRFWTPLPAGAAVMAEHLARKEYQPLLMSVLNDPRKQDFTSPLAGELLCAFSPHSAAEVRSAFSLVIMHRDTFLRCMHGKLALTAQRLDGAEATAHGEFLAKVLGEGMPEVLEYSAASRRIQEFASAPVQTQIEMLGAAASVRAKDGSAQAAVGAAARARLLSEAEQLLEKGETEQALEVLIKLDPEHPNERVTRIATDALSRPIGEWLIVNNRAGAAWFRMLAAQDNTVKTLFVDQLYQTGRYPNTAANSAIVRQYLSGLMPMHDPRWKELTFQHAFNLDREGREDEASGLLSSAMPAPNFQLQIKTWKILYGEWAFVFFLCITAAWAVYKITKKLQDDFIKKETQARQEAAVQEMMDETANDRPEGFAYITRGKALSEDQDEYFRILIRFGLSPKSSLAELKATYRKRVKKVHPDTAGGSDPGAKAEFMELTQAYERAVELRSRLGLPNE